MQFSPEEMASLYRQAKDKREQIKVFVECNMISEDQVRKLLVEQGITPQQLPRRNNQSMKKKNPRQKRAADAQCQESAPTPQPADETVPSAQESQARKFGELAARMEHLFQIGGKLAAGFRRIEDEIAAMEEAIQEDHK